MAYRSEFDHFLLTRLNVNPPLPPNAWLRSRLDILRRWALPTVRRQMDHLDGWLIFCNAESPAWFRDELCALLHAREEVIWVEGSFSGKTAVDAIAPRLTNKKFLITTRLDSDDAISDDFVQLVQSCFDHQGDEFINFTYGAQYSNGEIYFRADPSNAFVSLIERRNEHRPMGVFVDWHTRIHKYGLVRQVKTHPTWIQNVHGGNIANYVSGIPVAPEEVLRHFALDVPIRHRSPFSLFAHKIRFSTALAFKVLFSAHRIKWLLRTITSGPRILPPK